MVLFVSLFGDETGKPENRKLHPGTDLKEGLCETTLKDVKFLGNKYVLIPDLVGYEEKEDNI